MSLISINQISKFRGPSIFTQLISKTALPFHTLIYTSSRMNIHIYISDQTGTETETESEFYQIYDTESIK